MEQIILDISSQILQDSTTGIVESEVSLGRLEVWHYEHLVRALEGKMDSPVVSNKYVLVKLPINELPDSVLTNFYKMQIRGYIPIVAQAERNTGLRDNPNLLYTIVSRGALVQINTSSLTGSKGRSLRKFTLKLCKHNLVHLVCSDAPNPEKSLIALKSAYGYIQKKLSANHIKVLRENAKHILNGADFHVLPPIKFK